jgi:hypothetical protein
MAGARFVAGTFLDCQGSPGVWQARGVVNVSLADGWLTGH